VLGSIVLAALLVAGTVPAVAQERLCDPAFEDCRAPLLDLIRGEATGIDVAFWFMEDGRYAAELIAKARQGVPVRVLVDPRANREHPVNAEILAQLAAAGIPMRRRVASGILHWKLMLFAGQRIVQFSGANYSPHAFRPDVPFGNYTDEAIFFTGDPAVVESFMRRFDDLWTDTAKYADHANMAGQRTRRYPLHAVHPDLNFPPGESYRRRSIARYDAETTAIDATMYRITDRAHTDALIAAVARGVPVRLITAPEQYRDPTRLWHSWNVDRLYMAGVQVRHSAHQGLNHQKSVQLASQGLAIFGSSNWTSPSSDSQEEHNYFTTKSWIVDWFGIQFHRKWTNLAAIETEPFQPLPPDRPIYSSPVSVVAGASRRTALVFDGGPFAHLYDIYFGTTPAPPLFAANVPLGPRQPGRALLRYDLPSLAPHTTYYWRVVSRTMALQEAAGDESTFTTDATGAALPPGRVSSIPGDVDGDRKGDLIWRHTQTGGFALWRVDGLRLIDSLVLEASPSPDVQVAGFGDLDGDGRADAVLRDSRTGDVWARLSTGGTSGQLLAVAGGAPFEWQIAGVADVDGDAKADVIWQHRQSGGVVFWLMDGGTLAQRLVVSPAVIPDWQIAGVGDVDGDGAADLVWRHSQTGGVVVWLIGQGTLQRRAFVAPAVAPVWQIAGMGDVDGDGNTDIIWRQTQTGDVVVWLMAGAAVKQVSVAAFGVSMAWQVGALSDFDGDGTVDMAWRNAILGDVVVWLMDRGAIRQRSGVGPGVPLEWQIQR
jgi:hypothetical protein